MLWCFRPLSATRVIALRMICWLGIYQLMSSNELISKIPCRTWDTSSFNLNCSKGSQPTKATTNFIKISFVVPCLLQGWVMSCEPMCTVSPAYVWCNRCWLVAIAWTHAIASPVVMVTPIFQFGVQPHLSKVSSWWLEQQPTAAWFPLRAQLDSPMLWEGQRWASLHSRLPQGKTTAIVPWDTLCSMTWLPWLSQEKHQQVFVLPFFSSRVWLSNPNADT